MKFFLSAVFFFSLTITAFAQSGPGPTPQPWIVNGATISYNNGGVTVPSSVTGGTKGVGTINATGLYVGGVAVNAGGVTPGPITASGLTMATGQLLGRTTAGTGAIELITPNTNFGLSGGLLSLAPINSGYLIGNATISSSEPTGVSASDFFDQAFGNTRGALLERGATAWSPLLPSVTSGLPLLSGGSGADPSYGALSLSGTAVTNTLPVTRGGTGLTGGTSGGVPYFSSTSTIASSAALGVNRLVLGGGTGAAPTNLGSLGTSTTVLHGNAAGAPTFGAVALATDVSGILPGANGGTGNGFFAISGPTASLKTFTVPNVSANILTDSSSSFTSAQLAGALTNETGSGVAVFGTAPTISNLALTGTVSGSNTVPLTVLAQSGANTVLGNWSNSTGNVSAKSMPSCVDSGGNHLNYVAGTGVICGNSGSVPSPTAFFAYTGSTISNVTGDGSFYTIVLPSVMFNVNGGYSTSTGVFTAPSSGIFQFNASITLSNLSSGHIFTDGLATCAGSNYRLWDSAAYAISEGNQLHVTGTILVTLTTGQTCNFQVRVGASTKTVGILGGANVESYIQGFQFSQ